METLEEILSRVLTKEQRDYGFSVYEDENYCYLKLHGKIVVTWQSLEASCGKIKDTAEIMMREDNKIWTKLFAC